SATAGYGQVIAVQTSPVAMKAPALNKVSGTAAVQPAQNAKESVIPIRSINSLTEKNPPVQVPSSSNNEGHISGLTGTPIQVQLQRKIGPSLNEKDRSQENNK